MVEALRGPQDTARAMFEAFRRRRDLGRMGLDQVPGVSCPRPVGAFYAWPNVTAPCRAPDLADWRPCAGGRWTGAVSALLSDVHFGPRIPGEGEHLRLSFAASTVDLTEGIRRLDAFARSAHAGQVELLNVLHRPAEKHHTRSMSLTPPA